jgi:hypothetical protein
MAVKTIAELAWLVQVTEDYGTRKIMARVVVPQENGELHAPGTYRFDVGHEFADLNVYVYLGEIDSRVQSDGGKTWGLSHDYTPHTVRNVEQAADIVSVFKKIERGLDKANETSGYVREGDFLAYLTRIGNAIGVRRYYVRNHKRALDNSGERYREVTVSALQYWIDDTVSLAESSPGELTVRG